VDLVAAAVGDVAQLLDVDVDQIAGGVTFVAAYRLAGGPVQIREPGQAVADQYPVHRGRVQAEQVSDAGGTPAVGQPDLDDSPFGACRDAARAATRP